MAQPQVTVFMAVYNREGLLREAIESVLAQTLPDFELLILDDGSTDASVEVARSYRDRRIRVVEHSENWGTPRTRNHGLDLAVGKYLAILDSDDCAYPQRLARQVHFLEGNPSIAAVGSWAIGTNRAGTARRLLVRATDPREIHARILFVSCFKNPTMMARTEVLRKFRYREQFAICQDIDLWARISAQFALANLPAFLIRYRGGGGSHADRSLQRQMRLIVIRDQLDLLGVTYDEAEVDLHERLRNVRGLRADADFVTSARDWLERLVAANASSRVYPEPEFTRAAAERWLLLNLAALRNRVVPAKLFARSPLRPYVLGFVGTYGRLLRAYLRELSRSPTEPLTRSTPHVER